MADTNQKEVLVTKAGLEKLKVELKEFQEVKRKEVAARLKEAIAYFDHIIFSFTQNGRTDGGFI